MSECATSETIAAIYEAAIEDDGLARVAAIVRAEVGADNAGIWLTSDGAVTDLTVTEDIAASTAPYLAYFHRIDPWAAARVVPNAVFLGHEQVDEASLLRGEFYNDFARHFGMRRPMGVVLDVGPGILASVSTNRAGPGHLLDEPDRARLARLVPHMRAALRLRGRFAGERAARRDLAGALDTVAFGAVICARDATVLFANDAARTLGSAGAIRLGGRRQGLAGLTADDTRRLRAAVAAAVENRPGSFQLAQPDGTRLSLIVTPLAGASPGDPGRALVTMQRIDVQAGPPAPVLRRLFGLTAAQAELGAQLARGLTLEAAASERGTARSTARTHLHGILERTGTANLRDLLRLLGSLPPHAG